MGKRKRSAVVRSEAAEKHWKAYWQEMKRKDSDVATPSTSEVAGRVAWRAGGTSEMSQDVFMSYAEAFYGAMDNFYDEQQEIVHETVREVHTSQVALIPRPSNLATMNWVAQNDTLPSEGLIFCLLQYIYAFLYVL